MRCVNLARGLIFCCLWYFSIFFGFAALYCPLIPLLIFSNYAFRAVTDRIFSFWELYPTALLQFFGTKIYVHGDYVNPGETSLIVSNHRTRVDWNFLWLCMFHATRCAEEANGNGDDDKDATKFDAAVQNGKCICHNTVTYIRSRREHRKKHRPTAVGELFAHKSRLKYVLKDDIRHIPGPGWVMQMNCFMYIKRNWQKDENEIAKVISYLDDINYTYQLLIFPEGTDLTESNLKKSNAFAAKNNLAPFKQVLHPRTRGFISLAQSLYTKMGAIYDITIGYSSFQKSNTPSTSCSLKDMICGRFPTEVHFTIKRYAVNTLPDDEELLGKWLQDRWSEKEIQLDSFYKNGMFPNVTNRLQHREKLELVLAFIFWSCLVTLYPLGLFLYSALRWTLLCSCIVFVLLNLTTGGFHHLEMKWYRLKHGAKMKRY